MRHGDSERRGREGADLLVQRDNRSCGMCGLGPLLLLGHLGAPHREDLLELGGCDFAVGGLELESVTWGKEGNQVKKGGVRRRQAEGHASRGRRNAAYSPPPVKMAWATAKRNSRRLSVFEV